MAREPPHADRDPTVRVYHNRAARIRFYVDHDPTAHIISRPIRSDRLDLFLLEIQTNAKSCEILKAQKDPFALNKILNCVAMI